MNKADAIKVLFEINDGCKSLPNRVKIDHPSSHITQTSSGYQIRLKDNINAHSKDCIKHILEKYKLEMRKENGFVILYTLDSKCSRAQVM
jgi:hypothetical protein